MRSSPMNAVKKTVSSLALALGIAVWTGTCAYARPNTDVSIDTDQAGLISLNEKPEPAEERLTFYKDDVSKVGLNSDGDPAWSSQF